MPSMLGIDLSPATGATIDSIAGQEMTTARGAGDGGPEQGRLTMAGLEAVRTRFHGSETDVHGTETSVVLTNYVTLVGGRAVGLYFLVDAASEAAQGPLLEAMAQSLEIPDRADCPTAS